MALTGKKYEKFYATTGTGSDKAKTETLTQAETFWDADRANGCKDLLKDFTLGPIVFQLQQMQDELDYLRTEIEANKNKTGITSQQTTDISSNKTNIATNTTAINTKLTVVPNSNAQAGAIQDLRVGVEYNIRTKAHEFLISYTETTSKATLRKTGSIQLK